MDRILGFFDPPMLVHIGMMLLNTGVLCFVLAYFLYIPAKNFLRKRAERIQSQLETAENDYRTADELKAKYENMIKGIDNERVEILETARKHAQLQEQQIIAKAKEEAEIIKNRAMQDIKLEQDKARDDVKKQMVEISAIMAAKYISTSIDNKTQNQLLDSAIKELGDVQWLN